MVTLLAPWGNNLFTGGYLYNRRVQQELSRHEFSYVLLPSPLPSPDALETSGVNPDSNLLLDSLFFNSPRWVREVKKKFKHRMGMLIHYLPSLDPSLSQDEAERYFINEARCFSQADKVAAVSGYTADTILTRHSVSIPMGIFYPGTEPPGEMDLSPLRSSLDDAARGEVNLLTIANWTIPKNHIFLIDVLETLGDLPWMWKIFGSGENSPLTYEFRKRAEKAGLGSRIQIGRAISPEQVWYQMNQADLFLNPSIFESYGMTVAEALAASLPVVCNRIGGVPEVTGGSPGARMCTPGDHKEWSFVLRELILSPNQRSSMSAAAVRRAAELPSWKKTALALLNFMEEK